MTAIEELAPECERSLESLAAELTEAVVPVALEYGVGERWLDLELDLWHVLSATVKRWGRMGEFDVARSGLLAALAEAAYRTTLRHGERESPRPQPALHQAFRSAMRDRVSSSWRQVCQLADSGLQESAS